MKAAQYGTKDIYKILAARVAKESGIDKNLLIEAVEFQFQFINDHMNACDARRVRISNLGSWVVKPGKLWALKEERMRAIRQNLESLRKSAKEKRIAQNLRYSSGTALPLNKSNQSEKSLQEDGENLPATDAGSLPSQTEAL